MTYLLIYLLNVTKRRHSNIGKQTLFVYHATMHDTCDNTASIVIHLQCYALVTTAYIHDLTSTATVKFGKSTRNMTVKL